MLNNNDVSSQWDAIFQPQKDEEVEQQEPEMAPVDPVVEEEPDPVEIEAPEPVEEVEAPVQEASPWDQIDYDQPAAEFVPPEEESEFSVEQPLDINGMVAADIESRGITFDNLIEQEDYMSKLRRLAEMEGETFENNEDLVEWFEDEFTFDAANTIGIVDKLIDVASEDDKEKLRLEAEAMALYQNLPDFWEEGGRGLSGLAQNIIYGIADPVNVVSLGLGGQIAKQVAKQGGKSIMQRAIATTLGTAAVDAGISAVTDVGLQQTEKEVGLREEFDPTRTAFAGAIGAAPTMVVQGTRGAYGILADKAGKRFIQKLEQEAVDAGVDPKVYMDARLNKLNPEPGRIRQLLRELNPIARAMEEGSPKAGEAGRAPLNNTTQYFMQRYLDSVRRVKTLERDLAGAAGEQLDITKSKLYRTFRFLPNQSQYFDEVLGGRGFKSLQNGVVDTKTGSGTNLKQIIESTDDFQGFLDYVSAERARIASQKKTTKGGKPTSPQQYLNRTDEELEALIKVGRSKYKDTMKLWSKFQEDTLDFLVETGQINKETRARLADHATNELGQFGFYIPFYRTYDSLRDGKIVRHSGMPVDKNLKGSSNPDQLEIADLFNNYISYLSTAVEMGYKNDAKRQLYNLVKEAVDKNDTQALKVWREYIDLEGSFKPARDAMTQTQTLLDEGIELEDLADDFTRDIVKFWRDQSTNKTGPSDGINVLVDGKLRTLKVKDELLLDALDSLGPNGVDTMSNFLKPLAAASDVLRATVTTFPTFTAKQAIIDANMKFVLGGEKLSLGGVAVAPVFNFVGPVRTVAKALQTGVERSQIDDDLIAAGAAFNSARLSDTAASQNSERLMGRMAAQYMQIAQKHGLPKDKVFSLSDDFRQMADRIYQGYITYNRGLSHVENANRLIEGKNIQRQVVQEDLARLGLTDLTTEQLDSILRRDFVDEKGIPRAMDGLFDASTAKQINEIVKEATAQGAFSARNVSTDFSRRGSSRGWQQFLAIMPFFNAGLQGTVTTVERIKQNPTGVLARGLLAVTLPAVVLRGMTAENDVVNDVPEEVRELYYVIPHDENGIPNPMLSGEETAGLYYWPKPYEVGTFFANGVEKVIEGMNTDKDWQSYASDLGRMANSLVSYGAVPQGVAPISEVLFNENFFGAPITPAEREGLGRFDYGPETSMLARGIGESLNASPAVIEHLMKGYTGSWGSFALDVGDRLYRYGDPTIPDKPGGGIETGLMQLRDLPIVETFTRGTTRLSQSKIDFYRILENSGALDRAVNNMEKYGRADQLVELFNDTPTLAKALGVNKAMRSLVRELGAITAQETRIAENNAFSAEQKFEKIDDLRSEKDSVLRQFMKAAYADKDLRELTRAPGLSIEGVFERIGINIDKSLSGQTEDALNGR